MGQGAQAMADIAELDQLAEQLSQSYPGPAWTMSTSTPWPANSGDQATVDARTLAELERALMNQGFLDRGSDGKWRLSPKAMRQLGRPRYAMAGPTAFGPSRRAGDQTRRAAGELTGATQGGSSGTLSRGM